MKFDWLGPQKSLIFLGSQIHPRYQILFQVLDASLFCVLIGGPNSFLLWRIQSSQEKVKAPEDASNAVMDFPDFTIEDGWMKSWWVTGLLRFSNALFEG